MAFFKHTFNVTNKLPKNFVIEIICPLLDNVVVMKLKYVNDYLETVSLNKSLNYRRNIQTLVETNLLAELNKYDLATSINETLNLLLDLGILEDDEEIDYQIIVKDLTNDEIIDRPFRIELKTNEELKMYIH